MTTIAEALAIAVQHHHAGRLQAAEQIYRQILTLQPDHADAMHMLGVVAYQMGRDAAAAESLRRAIGLKGSDAAFHYNLSCVLIAQRKFDEASASCQRALELKPDYPEVHNNLGLALKQEGRLAEAAASFRRALALRPDWAEPLYSLGLALGEQENYAEAAACLQRVAELKPDHVDVHEYLGFALMELGKLDEAAVCHRRAIELNPRDHTAHNNLGVVLEAQAKPEEAMASFRRAIELNPSYAGAHNNLGNVRKNLGMFAESVVCYRRALELDPSSSYVYCGLGDALGFSGRIDDAVACYRRAVELMPDNARVHSCALLIAQYRGSVTLRELAEAHAEYDQKHATPLRTTWRQHENTRDPKRCLRLGFLSADLHRHPVGYFAVRLLENLDSRRCEAVCYRDGAKPVDDLTARFQAAATVWSNVAGSSDEQLAEQIRGDRIDVLFDLAGHTGGNRLPVFARKPAPIQVTWCGYEGTTGLSAMDYILADRYVIPPHSEIYYRERVLRMPDGYVCYDPPAYAPPVSALPALANGHVTFAAFHNPAKIGVGVVDVWARVLQRLPTARLVLKYRGMADPSVTGRLGELFRERGVDPSRLEFLGFSEHRDYLAHYGRVDLALDPFPFNGGVTTCESLWMGVPVVTCPGETFAGRHSLSHLSNVGLTETIAGDLQQYVEIAVALASDLPRLAALRSGLRERMAASALCDGKRFAENFAEILRGVWRDWCETGD